MSWPSMVALGDNPTAPPEANTPLESAHPATEPPTRRGFHEAALTGLAIAGGVAAIAVNLVAEAMDQETYEQARIVKIKQELAILNAKQKPGESKSKLALGKTLKPVIKNEIQTTKPQVKAQIQAA